MIEQINNENRIILSNLSTNSIINNEIVNQLIEFGYKPIYSKRIFQFFHPNNIEEALNYLLIEDGKIQHNFIKDRNNMENQCYLCGEDKNIHLSQNLIDNIIINNSFVKNENENKSVIKIECPACDELFIANEKNTLKNCCHSFCNECWFDFLSIKIKENKLTSIKCLEYECREKPDDDFIINLLNSNEELIEKYKKFKLELEIINDPNRKFCPFPNCNSFLELKDKNNKEVKCSNNHIFCFLCLGKPHGNSPCNNEINKSMVEYEKNNFLKKCPKCNIITEKMKGCNHIICAKCNYQWCWLCNGEFDPEHFYEGKCKGLQFFRPKDENEINLALQRKIQLRQSQIQEDVDYNNDSNVQNDNINNSVSIVVNSINDNRNNSINDNLNNNINDNSINDNSINDNLNNNINDNIQNDNSINDNLNSNIFQNNDMIAQNSSLIQSDNNNINNNNNFNDNRIIIHYNRNSNINDSFNNINNNMINSNYIIISNNNVINNNSFINNNIIINNSIINNSINNNSINNNSINNNSINNNSINNNSINNNNLMNDRSNIDDKNNNLINNSLNNKDNNNSINIISKELINNNNQNNSNNNLEFKNNKESINSSEISFHILNENKNNNIISMNNNNSINNNNKNDNSINNNNKNDNNINDNNKNDHNKNDNNMNDHNMNYNNMNYNNMNAHNMNGNDLYVIPFNNNIPEKKRISQSENIRYKKKNIINNEININIKNNNDINDNNINDNIINNNNINDNNINDNIINNNNKKDINDSYIINSIINDNNKKDNNDGNINYNYKKDINDSNSDDINKTDSFNEENNNPRNIQYNLEKNNENSEKNRINNNSYISDKIRNDNKIHNFTFSYLILIIFIYIFFGHFFILINICFQNLSKNYFRIILIFLIIAYLEIPFFFYQFYTNLILLNIYLYKIGFKSFISHFSDIIKMKFQKNNFHAIAINAYYIFVILIFGTFIFTKKLLYKKKSSFYILMAILGIIVDLLILPLHIIINPFILRYIAKTKKYDDKMDENYDKSKENFYKKFYNFLFKK